MPNIYNPRYTSTSSYTSTSNAKINTPTKTGKASLSRNFKKGLIRNMIAPLSRMKNTFGSKALSQPISEKLDIKYASVNTFYADKRIQDPILVHDAFDLIEGRASFDTPEEFAQSAFIYLLSV